MVAMTLLAGERGPARRVQMLCEDLDWVTEQFLEISPPGVDDGQA
jgi:hypothetical protein